MPPKLNRHAPCWCGKVDQLLSWEARYDHELDIPLVGLGNCLCEVRAGQYWRLENRSRSMKFLI
jgi:hypothetical protein